MTEDPEIDMPLFTFSGRRCKCKWCGSEFWGLSAYNRHRKGPPGQVRCIQPASGGLVKTDGRTWTIQGGKR
jgi:hypothetical protein